MTNIIIAGGRGFIGANATEYFLSKHYQVLALDNLSRVGSEQNLTYFNLNINTKTWKRIVSFVY